MVKNIKRFSGCLSLVSPEKLRQYCPSGISQSVAHNGLLYTQGETCRDVFSIISGQVKISRVNPDGSELTTALLGEGDIFGLEHGAGVEAVESAFAKGPVLVWRGAAAQFRELLSNHSGLGLCVIEMMSQRQRRLERRLQSFAFKGTEVRLAETFRELSGSFEKRCEHGLGMHLRLTQQELADLVGATRPVVSVILNQLRRKGVLGYNREYVCVQNIEAIERLTGI